MSIIRRCVALSTVAAGVLGAGIAAGPADATPAAPALATVRITATKLAVRSAPTSKSAQIDTRVKNEQENVLCKVHGQSVGGNDIWYQLNAASAQPWISARYAANVGAAPRWCGDGTTAVARTTIAVIKREAPTTTSLRVSTLPKGTKFTVSCKLGGQSVGGNRLWYYTTDGNWIPARYAANVGKTPAWCI